MKKSVERRLVDLPIDVARQMYHQGGTMRETALCAFDEKELTYGRLPKTWEEFCESSFVNKEYFIGIGSKIACHENTFRYSTDDKNLLPSEEAAKAHLALMQLHQLRDCYRQGWKPNWNSVYNKYCIESNNFSYDIVSYTSSVRFLAFQTRERAMEFLSNFRDLIEEVVDLI